MPIIETFIASLNPDAGKSHYKFLNENRKFNNIENFEDANVPLLIDNYQINYVEEAIKKEITNISFLKDNWNGMGSQKISSEVLNNSINIINALPPSVLYYLNPDNVYPSKYGTLIFDWEFGNKENCLSLEIARNSVGYFVEKDGKDYKQVEQLNTNDTDFDNTITSIVQDLAGFLI